LAGSVGAEQPEEDPLGHVEVEAVDRGDRAEALDNSAELYRRHRPVSPGSAASALRSPSWETPGDARRALDPFTACRGAPPRGPARRAGGARPLPRIDDRRPPRRG